MKQTWNINDSNGSIPWCCSLAYIHNWLYFLTCLHGLVASWIVHWDRVTHICVNEMIIIGSDNGLSPGRRQVIIWTDAWILVLGSLGINFSEINTFYFKKIHVKLSSSKWRLFRRGLNELKACINDEIPGNISILMILYMRTRLLFLCTYIIDIGSLWIFG